MGGGQTSTTNSTQVADKTPWAPAIPGLQSALTDAQNLYQSGVGSQIYNGQRVADFSNDQSAGIQSTRDQAAADNSGGIGTSYLQNVLGSNGISSTTQQGLNMLSAVPEASTARLSGLADQIGSASNPINQTANSFMSGSRDLTTIPQLQGLFAKSQAPSAAETNLSGIAAGNSLDPTKNALFQNLVNVSNQNAANATKEAYAASGRYGSGNFAGATTKAINDTDTALYANQYNTEAQRQLSANSQIDAARQAASGLGSNILGQIGSVEGTNNQQRLAGAGLGQAQQAAQANVLGQVLGGDQFNSQLGVTKANGFIGAGQQGQAQALQAAGLLPSVDALRYAPASNLLQVGALQQQQAQQNLEAAQQYFQDQQQTPWQALSQYAAYPLAIGSQGGTTVTQGTQQSAPTATVDLRGQRMAPNQAIGAAVDGATDPVSAQNVIHAIDGRLPLARGSEEAVLRRARGMLARDDVDGFEQIASDPRILHNVKQEMDTVINYGAPDLGVTPGAQTRKDSAAQMVRGHLNELLRDGVPGYAAANDASSALARRIEAVQAGSDLLRSGQGATAPADLARLLGGMAPAERAAMAQGSRAAIDQAVGTRPNDLTALQNLFQIDPRSGQGGWNAANLAQLHGQEPVDRIVGAVNRERAFTQADDAIVQRGQAAQQQAAADRIAPRSTRGDDIGGAVASLAGMTGGPKAYLLAQAARAGKAGINAAGQAADVARNRQLADAITLTQGDRLNMLLDAINARGLMQQRAAQLGQLGARGTQAALMSQSDRARPYLPAPNLLLR